MGKIISTMDEVAIGLAEVAWSNAPASDKAKAAIHSTPVPLDDAIAIVGWEPIGFELPTLVDPTTMEAFDVPSRYQQAVGRVRPDGSRGIINIAGSGYAKDLHNTMREATFIAADSELDITLAACHNDGEFLCLQMLAREGLNLGKPGGGYVPMVTLMSSLTGATQTGVSTGTLRLSCTNQLRQFNVDKVNQLRAKRTRFAETKITAAAIHIALEMSFAETKSLVDEMERLCNIEATDAQVARVLDGWRPLHDADGAPLAEGRARTIRENERGTFTRLLHNDPRVGLGQTVGGLWQAHNTFQHWEAGMRNSDNRIARMAERASLNEADNADAEFMAIVAGIIPETTLALANA